MTAAVQMPTNMANIHNSSLMTADPYHVPGYGGFCPQFKYQIGDTFGRTTSRLLNDGQVASSGRLVLVNNSPASSETDAQLDGRMDMIRTRTQSWGDQKLVDKMVPGYSGFVPKNQHYFGKRYTENCNKAISDFEVDQRAHNKRIAELRLTEALQSGKMEKKAGDLTLPNITNRYTTPLDAIAKGPKPFVSRTSPPHSLSPYNMRNESPDKRFMSGYTGFVPKARGLLGSSYPLITHMALNEFTNDSDRQKAQSAQPFRIHREDSPKIDTKPIYPTESGLVPHYTGHIPGETQKCGQTFGESTRNTSPMARGRQAPPSLTADRKRRAKTTRQPTRRLKM